MCKAEATCYAYSAAYSAVSLLNQSFREACTDWSCCSVSPIERQLRGETRVSQWIVRCPRVLPLTAQLDFLSLYICCLENQDFHSTMLLYPAFQVTSGRTVCVTTMDCIGVISGWRKRSSSRKLSMKLSICTVRSKAPMGRTHSSQAHVDLA